MLREKYAMLSDKCGMVGRLARTGRKNESEVERVNVVMRCTCEPVAVWAQAW